MWRRISSIRLRRWLAAAIAAAGAMAAVLAWSSGGDGPGEQAAGGPALPAVVQLVPPLLEALDGFGRAVAIEGDTAVVGAHFAGAAGAPDAGLAYVYRRDGGGWALASTLAAGDATAGSQFGLAAAIDGDTIVIGAPGDDAGGTGSGAAYVFRRRGDTWRQEAKLTADDAGALDLFGWSVAVREDLIAVGAPGADGDVQYGDAGAAYVFRLRGDAWRQEARLPALDVGVSAEAGFSVALGGGTAGEALAVGVPRYDGAGPGSGSGAVFVFRARSGGWALEGVLAAPGAAVGDRLGHAVAFSGDTVLAGVPDSDEVRPNSNSGAAHVFRLRDGAWDHEAKLTPAGAQPLDGFGGAVALDGDTAVVGARGADLLAGAAYVFQREAGAWTERAKVFPADASATDLFGVSVAVSGETALVGSPHRDTAGLDASGAAHLFPAAAAFRAPRVVAPPRAAASGGGSDAGPSPAPTPVATPPPRVDGLTGAPVPPPGAASRDFDAARLDLSLGAGSFEPLNDIVPVPARAATWMLPNDIVLGAVQNGQARAYPVFMMEVHHVANDILGGKPYLATF